MASRCLSAECINCTSAKTPEKKGDIEAISTDIAQVKQRIILAEEPAEGKRAGGRPVATNLGGSIDVYA
jgi:hypothetical protein